MTRIVEVTSPLPGVFFRCPSADKPPFVEVGDEVSVGQALGLVEIMKQFASLDSTAAGVVAEICVSDAENVDAGAVVFRIEARDE